MTLFALKLIAVGTMLIDHVGLLFFPEEQMFRVIGRIAFPIFAWGIANGYHHTTDVKKYLSRLLLLAVVSQVPYSFIFGTLYGIPWRMNIFVTLALGLVTIMLYERFRHDVLRRRFCVMGMIAMSLLIPTGYGVYGLVMILLFHTTYGKTRDMLLWQGLWFAVILFATQHIAAVAPTMFLVYLALPSFIQGASLCALPLLAMYNQQKGYSGHPWWFYWFYPVHLTFLFILYVFG